MQTFLPYQNFDMSAAVLDYKRLGKQRVECFQILNTLIGNSSGWKNHPCVLMWKGNEYLLCEYAEAVCLQWKRLGYKDTILPRILQIKTTLKVNWKPWWLGDERLHSSHRSNLLRKNLDFYKKFGWTESNNLSYFWPAKVGIDKT